MLLLTAPGRGECPLLSKAAFIHDELTWRRPRILENGWHHFSKAVASRWTDVNTCRHEKIARAGADYYTISLAVRQTSATISISGRAIHEGIIAPGTLHITAPSQVVCGIFGAPCDFLHLHVARAFLVECYETAHGYSCSGDITFAPYFLRDATIEQLGRALLSSGASGSTFGELYVDGLFLAIVARLLDLHANRRFPLTRPKIAALARWRLKRVTEYIDAHIEENITLADLAAAADLSRMHFAAQFRNATGFPPHEYLLRRRIDHAQRLLQNPNIALVDVALTVGFQSQAHFTTVFKRFIGETPDKWRQTTVRTGRNVPTATASTLR